MKSSFWTQALTPTPSRSVNVLGGGLRYNTLMGKYAWALMGLGIILIGIALFLIYSSFQAVQEGVTYENANADDITIELPFPGATVGHTFSVFGAARGRWFTNGSFPVVVLSPAGDVVGGSGAATNPPGGDWMTDEFVNYKTTIVLPDTFKGPATLVLKKDNLSGLARNDGSISIQITVQ